MVPTMALWCPQDLFFFAPVYRVNSTLVPCGGTRHVLLRAEASERLSQVSLAKRQMCPFRPFSCLQGQLSFSVWTGSALKIMRHFSNNFGISNPKDVFRITLLRCYESLLSFIYLLRITVIIFNMQIGLKFSLNHFSSKPYDICWNRDLTFKSPIEQYITYFITQQYFYHKTSNLLFYSSKMVCF